MADAYGDIPGLVGVEVGEAAYCIPCAFGRFDADLIQEMIDTGPDYREYTDGQGNVLKLLVWGDPELHGLHCLECADVLCFEDCSCYDELRGAGSQEMSRSEIAEYEQEIGPWLSDDAFDREMAHFYPPVTDRHSPECCCLACLGLV
jgi:hypothetical protein